MAAPMLLNPPAIELGSARIVSPEVSHIHGALEVHGAPITYTVEVPEVLASEEITLLVNGLGAFKKTSRLLAASTAQHGYANIRFSPIRGSNRSIWDDISDATGAHIDTMGAVLDDVAQNSDLATVTNGDRLDLSQIAVAGHSYGWKVATSYAKKHPDDISKLICIQGVGMEDPNLLRFLPRLPRFTTGELLPLLLDPSAGYSVFDARKVIHHALSDPAQTIGEILACHLADTRDDLPELSDAGIQLGLVSGKYDSLTPIEVRKVLHLIDAFVELDLGHLGPQRRAAKSAEGLVSVLQALDI